MNNESYHRILQTIAIREGITAEEVEREIQIAIDTGFDNPDRLVRNQWAGISFQGERPTAKEVIDHIVGYIEENG